MQGLVIAVRLDVLTPERAAEQPQVDGPGELALVTAKRSLLHDLIPKKLGHLTREHQSREVFP
jgi:hypothetical protein